MGGVEYTRSYPHQSLPSDIAHLFGSLRKRIRKDIVVWLLWSSYLLADCAASFCVGLISNKYVKNDSSTSNDNSTSADNDYLLAFWAPFLLLHLGGPDTITAFALEDNELWLRHALGLVVQVGCTGYVFLLTIPANHTLWLPTILVFLAGSIRFIERTLSLRHASVRTFRKSIEKETEIRGRTGKEIVIVNSNVNEEKLEDVKVVRDAYGLFNKFKGLIVNMIFSFQERNQSRNYFHKTTAVDALRVIEVELNFIYEAFFTKMSVLHNKAGYFFRSVSFCSVLAALVLFILDKRKDFNELDVKVTYILLYGAVALDAVSLLMLVFSDDIIIVCFKGTHLLFYVDDHDFHQHVEQGGADSSDDKQGDAGHLEHDIEQGGTEKHVAPYPYDEKRGADKKVDSDDKQGDVGHHEDDIEEGGAEKYVGPYPYDEKGGADKNVGSDDKQGDLGHHEDDIEQGSVEENIGPDEEKGGADKNVGSNDKQEDVGHHERDIGQGSAEKNIGSDDEKGGADKNVGSDDRQGDVGHHERDIQPGSAGENIGPDDEKGGADKNDERNFSKLLSDYMLYLLIMQPTMMSAIGGIGQIRYQDTCTEAINFFRKRKLSNIVATTDPFWKRLVGTCNNLHEATKKFISRSENPPPSEDGEKEQKEEKQQKQACKELLEVRTHIEPSLVKGDTSKSLLFDACMLAKKLRNLEGQKWKIIAQVWVEMLSFAACSCRLNTHVQQLSEGGEFISLVWLLMIHLGIGRQFQIKEGHATDDNPHPQRTIFSPSIGNIRDTLLFCI